MSRIAQDLATSPHNPPISAKVDAETSRHSMQRLWMEQSPHVAIIGAGISGLRCADVLIRAGARVSIFEARDRIGGRVNQVSSGSHLMDTGPNWIHGTQGNPISKLAKKTGTTVMEPEENQMVFDSSGVPLGNEESSNLTSEVWGTIIKAFKHSDENSAKIDKNESLFDYFANEYTSRFPGDQSKKNLLLKEARMWGPFVGEEVERQSLKFFFLEQCLDGENVYVASTYNLILAEIAKVAKEHANIRFEEPVKSIKYRDRDDDDSKVEIETNKARYEFDEAVVTCPLGWLKRNAARAFSPTLPTRLTQAINNIGYGKLEKLYVTFPEAFWLTKDNDEVNPTNSPCFIHFHSPEYHPFPESQNSTSWNQSIVSLAHLPPPTAHPTLLFYFYGDCGSHLTNLLSSHPRHSKTYNDLLTSFARPFYSRLPNYSADNPSCTPVSFLLTSWQQDPYAGFGSYSNFPVGLDQADTDIEVMRDAAGLSERGRGLWLAGEHTAPFVAVGTTTGAWWSGEGVARRIAKRYGLRVEDDEFQDEPVCETEGKRADCLDSKHEESRSNGHVF